MEFDFVQQISTEKALVSFWVLVWGRSYRDGWGPFLYPEDYLPLKYIPSPVLVEGTWS